MLGSGRSPRDVGATPERIATQPVKWQNSGLPPVTVLLAEADPLRSEGEVLADALRLSGVWVDMTLYQGVTHGFFGLYQIVNKAMFAQSQLARNLVLAFGD